MTSQIEPMDPVRLATPPLSKTMPDLQLPYQSAGLSQRRAAEVLLAHFTFGSRPGEVDRVLQAGLAAWCEAQLEGALEESLLEARLSGFDALMLGDAQINARYPSNVQVSAHARRYFPDLPVTTDFRAVLTELTAGQLGINSNVAVFPGWKGARLPLFRS